MAHRAEDAGRGGEQASSIPPSGRDLSALLRVVPLFAELAAPDLDRLLVGATPVRLDTGAAAFHQGDEARTFQVLLSGRLKLSQVTSDGQQVTLRYITPGEMFGGIAALNGKPYPASALAVAPSLAVRWDREVFQRHVQEQAQLSWKLIQELSRRFSEAQSRFREMATERVERRIARTLLRLAHQTGRRVEEGVLIDLPLSRQDLAEMVGTTQFTVSRVLSDWERRGLVEAGRGRVLLRHPHQLVLVAEDLAGSED